MQGSSRSHLVLMVPYTSALQRMLNCPHSFATVFVSPTTPIFPVLCAHTSLPSTMPLHSSCRPPPERLRGAPVVGLASIAVHARR